jgi:hypothetical protein
MRDGGVTPDAACARHRRRPDRDVQARYHAERHHRGAAAARLRYLVAQREVVADMIELIDRSET